MLPGLSSSCVVSNSGIGSSYDLCLFIYFFPLGSARKRSLRLAAIFTSYPPHPLTFLSLVSRLSLSLSLSLEVEDSYSEVPSDYFATDLEYEDRTGDSALAQGTTEGLGATESEAPGEVEGDVSPFGPSVAPLGNPGTPVPTPHAALAVPNLGTVLRPPATSPPARDQWVTAPRHPPEMVNRAPPTGSGKDQDPFRAPGDGQTGGGEEGSDDREPPSSQWGSATAAPGATAREKGGGEEEGMHTLNVLRPTGKTLETRGCGRGQDGIRVSEGPGGHQGPAGEPQGPEPPSSISEAYRRQPHHRQRHRGEAGSRDKAQAQEPSSQPSALGGERDRGPPSAHPEPALHPPSQAASPGQGRPEDSGRSPATGLWPSGVTHGGKESAENLPAPGLLESSRSLQEAGLWPGMTRQGMEGSRNPPTPGLVESSRNSQEAGLWPGMTRATKEGSGIPLTLGLVEGSGNSPFLGLRPSGGMEGFGRSPAVPVRPSDGPSRASEGAECSGSWPAPGLPEGSGSSSAAPGPPGEQGEGSRRNGSSRVSPSGQVSGCRDTGNPQLLPFPVSQAPGLTVGLGSAPRAWDPLSSSRPGRGPRIRADGDHSQQDPPPPFGVPSEEGSALEPVAPTNDGPTEKSAFGKATPLRGNQGRGTLLIFIGALSVHISRH
ncbi:collagen alpha-1(I) chain-like [Rhincodon typus]|uniref:collagen alpha-1(I) chain-like n=1 Tax=Rhincodon typus TaxID=259920 RepID=UPI002030ECA6|nr:collagen alpha-1(I) chain-like [Rhincodon typus]